MIVVNGTVKRTFSTKISIILVLRQPPRCFMILGLLKHSTLEEERFQGFGTINGIAIVTVFYTERCSDGKLRHRLISARRLDPLEKKAYENYLQTFR
jgi:hypothetical protein